MIATEKRFAPLVVSGHPGCYTRKIIERNKLQTEHGKIKTRGISFSRHDWSAAPMEQTAWEIKASDFRVRLQAWRAGAECMHGKHFGFLFQPRDAKLQVPSPGMPWNPTDAC